MSNDDIQLDDNGQPIDLIDNIRMKNSNNLKTIGNFIITYIERVYENQTLYDTNGDEIDIKGNIEYYLPRILSLHGQYKEQYEAKHTIDIVPKAELQKAEQIKRVYENMTVSQAVEVAKKLMPMLKPSRADKIGRAHV